MPVIKGRFIAEVEQSMPLKRALNVLLWDDGLTLWNWQHLLELDRLRTILRDKLNGPCFINLLVNKSANTTIKIAEHFSIPVEKLETVAPDGQPAENDDANLQRAVALALAHDVDYIVVPSKFLPYLEEIDRKYLVTLTDTSFLLRCVEAFVRGFGVAWSFISPMLNQTFTTLYLMSERVPTFQPGFDLMNELQSFTTEREVIETGRTLVYNRLSNICFTRDHLLFFSQQRQAALRNHSRHQEFKLELAYYLNFYYLLLYGAFDHAAMLVNGILKLGLKSRDIGATYPKFLRALQARSAELHALFTTPSTVDLLERFAFLRHYAAHRGSIAPAILVEAPTREISDAEIDDALRMEGGHEWLFEMADGPFKDGIRKMMRSNKRAAILEEKVLERDVVFIEIRGHLYQIYPLNDITWNFDKVTAFMGKLFAQLRRYISENKTATGA